MLREFRCSAGHVVEKILTSSQDAKTHSVKCYTCGKSAKKIDFSTPGGPILVAGIGGFYKPSLGK
jgi:hypothetical protein